MKVVVTGTRGIPNIMGGVETHCENLLPLLADAGIDVTVIRRKSYAGDTLTDWKGVRIIDIATPHHKSLEAIVHTFRAINRAKSLKANIVHIHAIGPAMLTPYARMMGMKVVFTHHGPDYDRDKWGRLARMMLRFGERMGCLYANDVIVISDVIKNLIADKYGRRKRVHLLYNGVPQPEITKFPEYFNELGIEPGQYLLGMCRFVPEKNLHHLVEAYTRLRKEGRISENMRLVLAGDTDFEDDYSLELKRKAREAGVVLTGFVKGKKLHSLLTNAACYILPSSHEGLPIALLEAMSYSLPVVVSDIPANLEVGLPEECYFPVGNIDMLADRIEATLSGHSEAQRIKYDMTPYDWRQIAPEVARIYAGLMNE